MRYLWRVTELLIIFALFLYEAVFFVSACLYPHVDIGMFIFVAVLFISGVALLNTVVMLFISIVYGLLYLLLKVFFATMMLLTTLLCELLIHRRLSEFKSLDLFYCLSLDYEKRFY